jgi:hypothetical protein
VIYHNIFGVRGVALGRCAVLIAELLAVDMVERESDYLGCYFAGAGSDFNVRIVEQPDPEGELLEPEHQDYDVIIYLDGQSQFESVEGCVVDSSSIVRLNL